MSTRPLNDDASGLQETEDEEEVIKLEAEVKQIAQKIIDYRTTLPDQLTSTLASLLASQRPVLTTRLEPDPETRPEEAGVTQDMVRENMALSVTDETEEAEKIRFLKQKISDNAATLPDVLNRMKEYMARIDRLESSNLNIHPAFKRNRTS